jgi:3D-(3,5/4)-trihydroxycyclohexane-1,2-dione acylhydrolase (decyclizing)
MGYEVAGGIGVKMAKPDSEVYVMVGDGSYMMANSEVFTSVMLGQKFILVVLDNRGYGCIHRLQTNGCGGAGFNNLLEDCLTANGAPAPKIDFTAHAKAMGAEGETVATISELEEALVRARAADKTYIISIDTDPLITAPGGCWWEVAIPEVSGRSQVLEARAKYDEMKKRQLENL